MNTLDRYLLRSILGGFALVLAVLLILGALFLFIGQQDDIGVGTYTAGDAFLFVLLNVPSQAWEMLPIAALIGALVGLGSLSRGSEITIMRAAGLSVWRLARPALVAGLLLTGLAVLLGEVLAPPLQQIAKQQKAFGKFENVSFAGRGGAWVRDDALILNVEQQSGGDQFAGMMVFEISPDHRLLSVGRAASATADQNGVWQLAQYSESRFEADRVVTSRSARRALTSNISGQFLGVAATAPNQLRSIELLRFVRHLRANGLDAEPQVFALWSRLARSIAVIFAVLLAMPFAFGTMRSSGVGARAALGIAIGLLFFLAQRMSESGVVVFNGDPTLLAWLPTLLLATASLTLIARAR